MATCTLGRILGHEGVGVVDKVGQGVTEFQKGDRVLISCITSCVLSEGNVFTLRHRRLDSDGTQAEYVHITYADTRLIFYQSAYAYKIKSLFFMGLI